MKKKKTNSNIEVLSPTIKEKDYESLINTVQNYEERIKEIEGSIYWRTYQFFTKTKLILTSDSYLKSDKWRFFQRIRFLFSGPGIMLIRKFILQFFNLFFGQFKGLFKPKTIDIHPYKKYKEEHFPRESDLEEMRNNIANLAKKPSIEILAFIDENNFKNLNAFLNAIESQIYEKIRVCFVHENISEKIKYTLSKVIGGDEVYKSVAYKELSENFKSFTSDYYFFTDVNCLPSADCLYSHVLNINKNMNCLFAYSDNDFTVADKWDESYNPYFKPSYSPQTLWSRNYIGKCFLVEKNHLIDTKLPTKFNFYGMVLRFTHQGKHICHLSRILYHQIDEKVDAHEIMENHNVLNNYISTLKPGAGARLSSESATCFDPYFPLPKDNPLISIIIPCKNKGHILDTCLNSIFEMSTYKNFEIIIIDNGSQEKSFFSTVALWEYNYPTRIRCYRMDMPFNYSKLNNEAVKHANGKYLLFLNNDTELISPNLIETLLQFAQLENIGMVGPKLLYPNNTIQHAGIVLSIDDTGAHVYSGAYKDTAGYFNNTNCLTNYSAVTGACMMISKQKFKLVNGFDEALAVDCNDVELCCKLLDKGFFNLYVPFVKMIHYECLTRGNPMLSKRSIVRQQTEKGYFIEKWGNYIKNDPYYNVNLSKTSKNYELL